MTNEEGQRLLEIIIRSAQTGVLKQAYSNPKAREALADDTVLSFESNGEFYEGTFSDILRDITFNDIGASGSPLPFWATAFADTILDLTFDIESLAANLALNFAGYGDTQETFGTRNLFDDGITRTAEYFMNSSALTIPDMRVLFALREELDSVGNPYTIDLWRDDYFLAFIEKIKGDPTIIPAGGILTSFQEFEAGASLLARTQLATTVEVDDIYYASSRSASELAQVVAGGLLSTAAAQTATGTGENDYNLVNGILHASVSNITLTKENFEAMAAAREEIAALQETSATVNMEEIRGELSNLSSFEGAEELILQEWADYLQAMLVGRANQLVDLTMNQEQALQAVEKLIARQIENATRKALWETLEDKDAEDVESDWGQIEADALNAAQRDLSDSGLIGAIEQENPLTEDEIKRRQKFYQQCVLMVKMESLKNNFKLAIDKTKPFHENAVYNDRFYMVTDENNASFMNTILASKGNTIDAFLSTTPDIQAFLVPKMRFFKVYEQGGELRQVEFVFPAQNLPDTRTQEMFADDSRPWRGGGFGIKDFSFSFNGTSPATARNDITATLKLFFQDFEDFVREYDTKDDKGQATKVRFVDMILFDSSKASERVGMGNNSKQQYDASYYRIRADVGWFVPTTNDAQFNAVCASRRINPENIKQALRESNKSYYLNMVDHSLDFSENSTASITIEYRAYIESALKGNRFDALAGPAILKNRREREATLQEAIEDKCTQKEIAQLKKLFQAVEVIERKETYRRILTSLEDNSKVYAVGVTNDGGFRADGFFSEEPKLNLKLPTVTAVDSDLPAPETEDEDESENLIPTKFVSNDPSNTIQFFYLGDLIYLILDSLFDASVERKPQNTRFILPSIDFENFFTPGQTFKINLAQIPISVRYFSEWYNEFVLKPDRLTYPIVYFLRDLLSNLVVDALVEICLNKNYDKSFTFTTTSALSYQNVFNKDGPKSTYSQPIIDLVTNAGLFPFVTDPADVGADTNINDIYNYLLVVPQYNSISNIGRGLYGDDIKRGVYHFEYGTDRGILKSLKFSKTDMQYIREARFFQTNGQDGLMQLGAVYSVDLEMFGNSLFYPGMEIFINPFSLGGDEFKPTTGGSIANKLGLGGYHLITKVNSSISAGKFATSIKALFVYSGDGNSRIGVEGGVVVPIDTEVSESARSPKVIQNCSSIYNTEFANYRDLLENGIYSGIVGAGTNSVEEPTAQTENSSNLNRVSPATANNAPTPPPESTSSGAGSTSSGAGSTSSGAGIAIPGAPSSFSPEALTGGGSSGGTTSYKIGGITYYTDGSHPTTEPK
jgi:hypothetical protein